MKLVYLSAALAVSFAACSTTPETPDASTPDAFGDGGHLADAGFTLGMRTHPEPAPLAPLQQVYHLHTVRVSGASSATVPVIDRYRLDGTHIDTLAYPVIDPAADHQEVLFLDQRPTDGAFRFQFKTYATETSVPLSTVRALDPSTARWSPDDAALAPRDHRDVSRVNLGNETVLFSTEVSTTGPTFPLRLIRESHVTRTIRRVTTPLADRPETQGMNLCSDGALWVYQWGNIGHSSLRAWKVDLDSGVVLEAGEVPLLPTPGSTPTFPRGLFDGHRAYLTLDPPSETRTVTRYRFDGSTETVTLDLGRDATAYAELVDIDPAGNLLVRQMNAFFVFSPTGAFIGRAPLTDGSVMFADATERF